jgi:hypothetical protein
MAYYIQLHFLAAPKGALRGPAISHIFCNNISYHEYRGIDPALRLITPQCFSIGELETHVDLLKKELDEIKAEARKKYTDYKRLQKTQAEEENAQYPSDHQSATRF